MEHLTEILTSNDIKQKKIMEAMEDSLTAFSNITKVPVTFFSDEGGILWEVNRNIKYCISNNEYFDSESACKWNLKAAMKTASSLGDVYIFVCNTGMINMCYAFYYDEELVGYFNAGPVAMGKNRLRTMNSFFEKVPKEDTDLPLLMSISSELKVWSTSEVTDLSKLYLNALNAPFSGQEERRVRRQASAEQSMIGMKIIEMKKSRMTVKYPITEEENFINGIRHGDAAASKKQFSEYMGELMVFDGGNLSVIKLRLLTLLGKLFGREELQDLDYRNLSQMEAINNANTFAELVRGTNKIIDMVTEQTSQKQYSGSSRIVKSAADYIRAHFNEDINLKKISEEIHVNHTYLSRLFRREMQISIVDYINNLRAETAAELLRDTNESITEIAYACGFKDSGYFTKIFRKCFEMSPREYRNSKK